MKPVKNLLFAALLVFSLAFNSFAGDIDVPGAPEPPPPHMVTSDEGPTVESESSDETVLLSETTDYLFYEALAALLSVY